MAAASLNFTDYPPTFGYGRQRPPVNRGACIKRLLQRQFDYTSCPYWVPVLVHEPCSMPRPRECTVLEYGHINQTAWTVRVSCSWAQYRWPSVSVPLHFAPLKSNVFLTDIHCCFSQFQRL